MSVAFCRSSPYKYIYIYIIKDAVPTLLFHYAASFSLKCNCKHGKHWILLFHPLENPLPLLGQTPSKESEGPFCLRDHRAKPPGTPQRLECSSKQFWKKKNPHAYVKKARFLGSFDAPFGPLTTIRSSTTPGWCGGELEQNTAGTNKLSCIL